MKLSVPYLSLMLLLCAGAVFIAPTADAIVYVDKSAAGANNGTSWANAYTTIQPAIDAAFASGGDQVWVAGAPGWVVYNEARTELWGGPIAYAGSLVMKDNVAVYGGFEGWRSGTGQQETLLSQRAPGVNITAIDGSISRAGAPAYHVVVFGRGSAGTVNSRLDGFQIMYGNAAGVSGVYHTYRGGGIYNWRSNPIIANCRISANNASVSGGGVANEGISGAPANAQYINCVIDANGASRNIDWQNNPARGGGGVFNNQSSPTLIHVTITANTTGAGAALPGMPNYGLNSGGIYNVAVGGLPAAAPVLLSGIIWANTGTAGIINEAITGAAVAMIANYSDIAGGYLGAANINANPNFVGGGPFPYQINGAPCLDTGSSTITEDIRLVPRPIGAQRDMGAYEYSPNAPVAVCTGHTVNLDASCAGTMTAANIDGGSSAQAGVYKIVAGQTTFGSADIPSKSVTLTVYDKIGRTATCNATVTVNDPIAPVITFCPPNQNVNANAACVAPAPNLAALVTATDNCGIASITQVPVAGTLLPLGPTPIQITVTDLGGNAVLTCAPVVTVVDVTPPAISVCPPPVNLVPDPNCNVVVPNFIPSGAYADNCGIASVVQNPLAGAVVQGTTNVTITVTDTAGLTAQCVTQVIVNDTTNPVAVCQNVTVNLSSPTINGQAIDGGSTDNCGITTWLIDGNPTRTFNCGNIPNVPAILTVQDAAGNSNTCPAIVTVVDDVLPTAVCQNITVNLSAPTIPASAIDGGSTDNCGIVNMLIDGAPTKNFTCANLGPNAVTLTVFDAAGLSASCGATVTVVDDINPNAVCQDITVNLSAPTVAAAAIDGGSTDNCGVAGLLINGAANHTFVCADMPSTVAVLTVSDAAGNSANCNATVTVVDDIAPVITMNGISPVTVECGSAYTDAGAAANDNCDGPLVPNVNSNVNTAVPGPYTVTYTVSDAAGNPATPVVRQVNVVDTTAPIIGMNGASPVTVECGDVYTDAGATANDICDGALTPNAASTVNTAVPGPYTVTYTVSDAKGNPATPVVRQVNVVDTTVPVIVMNGVSPVTVECGTSYTDAGATAGDICAGVLTPNAASTVNVNLVNNYTVTYTVSDGNGNNAVPVVRQVNVVDTTVPVITRLGDAIVYVQLGDSYADDGATAADQCDGDITININTVNPVDTNTPNVYLVTYNVSDGQGNPAIQRTRTVIVSDTSQPDVLNVTVESELTVLVTYNKDMDGGVGVLDEANYTAAGSGLGTLNDHPDSVERVSATVYRLTWSRPDEMFNGGDIEITVNPDVEDSAGNFMRYNVAEDSGGALGEAPAITLIGSDETLQCGVDAYEEAGASAEDNVDGTVEVEIGGDTVDAFAPDLYVVTYTAVDAAGNEAVETRNVTVEDTADPEIALNGAAELWLECNLVYYVEDGATAWDACEGDLTSEIVLGGNAINTGVLGLQTVTYTVMDGNGNEAMASRDIHVQDTTAPVIVLNGANPYITEDGNTFTEPGYSAWDECEGDVTGAVVVGGDNPNTSAMGVYVISYSVSDLSLNVATAARTVVVKPETCELVLDLTVTPNPATPGSEVVFQVTELAGSCSVGALNYAWQRSVAKADFATIPAAPNAPTYTINSAAMTDAGLYRCVVSDSVDSYESPEVVLIVGTGIPAASMTGLLLAAAAAAAAGAAALRKRR